MKKIVLAFISVLILACGCTLLSDSSSSTEKMPVIKSFSISPANIQSGNSAILVWNVTGASTVTIDNGIGSVAISGTRAVAPTATTTYVLTAANAAGSTTASTQVLVSASAPQPDNSSAAPAIITFSASPGSISSGGSSTLTWSTSNATSVKIDPVVGNVAASGSTTVTPGSTITYTLTASNSSKSITASTQVVVSSGSSPSPGTLIPMPPSLPLTPLPFVTTVYDFIAKAPTAFWSSSVNLTFPGAENNNKGFALYRNNITLEDNNVYAQVLETHPQWITGGFIEGVYTELASFYQVQASDHFYSKVGFIKGASAGNVRFRVMFRTTDIGNIWIADVVKPYNGALTTIDIPLSAYAGKKGDFILRVDANNPNAAQDWAVWINAKITR